MLVVHGDAEACYIQLGVQQTAIAGELCNEELDTEVDRSHNALYTAVGDDIYAVDIGGANKLASGDLVAWDPTLKQVYIATSGKTTVTAIQRNGTEIWSVDVDMPITSIATRGDTGQLLVLAQKSDGFGRLIRIGGFDGGRLGGSNLPDADGDVEVSGNGTMVAVVREDNVNFFSMVIESEGEVEQPEKDPATCLREDQITKD